MGEGAYMELPFLGPSTERDALGKVVDLALDPTRLFIPHNKAWIVTASHVGAKIGDRGRYSETVDSVLYDSADGYAQARLLYLEHRRHDLGQTTAASEFEDPYAQ
jgi:phospholipid-binding lipoprotein MlaA